MKLHLDEAVGRYRIERCDDEGVTVNGQLYTQHLLVMPSHFENWAVNSFDTLSADDFEALKKLQPELILLGTGKSLRFPPADITAPMMMAGIGVEVMSTAAACRTYNVLQAEGRLVLAALLIG